MLNFSLDFRHHSHLMRSGFEKKQKKSKTCIGIVDVGIVDDRSTLCFKNMVSNFLQ